MELETELSKEDLVKLAECVNKILSESPAYKIVYARQECYCCKGHDLKCADYLPLRRLPV